MGSGPARPSLKVTPPRAPGVDAWRDRTREPALTALLVVQVVALFVVWPLAASGYDLARPVSEGLLIFGSLLVVFVSRSRGAQLTIVLGLIAVLGSLARSPEAEYFAAGKLGLAGNILLFAAVTWVVGRRVLGPGRVTHHRIQGAVVVYLNLGVIFALLYSLLCHFDPGAFTPAPPLADRLDATMLYFSYVTLTTTGYGDVAPVHNLARGLANLEALTGQLYLATTMARLITLELQARARAADPRPEE